MKTVRRLPPVLRRVRLVGALAILAALGISIWVVLALRGHWERFPLQLLLVALALGELSVGCTTLVNAYKTRSALAPHPRHATHWLDTRRGQLIGTFVAISSPMVIVVFALVISANSPLFIWGYYFVMFNGFLWLAATAWV